MGPFQAGTGKSLQTQGREAVASPLALLSDEVSIEPDGAGELLHVVVIDHRR